jgi:hypothetical protein
LKYRVTSLYEDTVFWVVTPRNLEESSTFWRSISLLSAESKNKSRCQKETGALLATRMLLGLLFDPEDGGDTFLRNVRLFPNYTTLQLENLSITLPCPLDL